VLSRKLDRKPAADSLFWKVVREFPQTEAQLAARDYLEMEGNKVPESLIVPPPGLVTPPRPAVAEQELTSPPAITPALGSAAATDPSAGHFNAGAPPSAVPFGAAGAGAASSYSAPYPGHSQPYRSAQLPDSVKHALAARDSMLRVAAQDTSAAGKARVDSLHHAFTYADTVGRAAQMAAIQRSVPVATGVVLAPGGGTAPNLSAGAEGAVKTPSSASVNASAPAGSAAIPGTLPIEGGPVPVADSTHGASAGVATAGATAAGVASTTHAPGTTTGAKATTPAKTAAPKPPPGGPISSLWVRHTKAEQDSIKHAKFVADSTKKAEKAAKKAEKHAKGQKPPAQATAPAAAPAATPAAADTGKAGQH
jgi:hypothetical protein